MNSVEYIEVLNKSSVFALSDFDLVLQHDNAPIHRASNVTSWLNQDNVETLDWPPYSPDLNIIENVWAILKRRLASSSFTCSSIADVKRLVENEWTKVTPQIISTPKYSYKNVKKERLCHAILILTVLFLCILIFCINK